MERGDRAYFMDDERVAEIDTPREILDALQLVEREIERVHQTYYAWKWVVIGLHSALQNVIVGLISDTHKLGALKPQIAERWLRAHYDRTYDYPREMLDAFPRLWERAKEQSGYVPTAEVDKDVNRLNGFRNDFVHFKPKSWYLEVSGMPALGLNCLEAIEWLGWRQDDMDWGFDRTIRESAQHVLASCRTKLLNLDSVYTEG